MTTDSGSDRAAEFPMPGIIHAYEDTPSTERLVLEAYAAHFVMWNAGINDTVTAVRRIVNAPVTGEYYAVVACRARGKEFVFFLAPLPTDAERQTFLEAWSGFAARQPRMTVAERDALVIGTATLRARAVLERGLRNKGLIS